ncbi:hypothetical protein CMI37_37320 [Candidatus Pacearchaeota archaeon]|nr:hypothetical protein [Candidatus Pacearchaeota archaeon]
MSKLAMPAIIPVAGMNPDFGMEWDASLIPVGPNYTAIEATVYECLHAGCTSIWIVANDDVAPLLRHRLGEMATDIDSIQRGTFVKFGQTKHLEVPIYYVPIHPKHRDKVDNYAWSVIHGANVAYWIHTKFSRWTRPDRYYISFPMGMMDPKEVLEYRSLLRKSAPFYFSHNGKTVKDGLPLSFVIDPEEWRRAKRTITTNAAYYRAPPEGQMPSEPLPKGERHVSLAYGLEDVFGGSAGGTLQQMKNFYDLTTWAGYVKFISSELGKRTKRPSTNTMYRGRNK